MIVIGHTFESELLSPRGLNKIKNIANRIELNDHRVNVLPLHFQNVPETRPGALWDYEAREKGYQIQKARKHGHQRPNVFSGDLEEAVLSSARVTATSKGGKITARGSRSSNLRGPRRDEIEAISKKEEQDFADRWLETVTALAQQPHFKKKTRKRSAAGQFI